MVVLTAGKYANADELTSIKKSHTQGSVDPGLIKCFLETILGI